MSTNFLFLPAVVLVVAVAVVSDSTSTEMPFSLLLARETMGGGGPSTSPKLLQCGPGVGRANRVEALPEGERRILALTIGSTPNTRIVRNASPTTRTNVDDGDLLVIFLNHKLRLMDGRPKTTCGLPCSTPIPPPAHFSDWILVFLLQ